MIISDRLCLSVLKFCLYRLIGISVKSHIGATLTEIWLHTYTEYGCIHTLVCSPGKNSLPVRLKLKLIECY